jgi:hypothetical protein
MGQVYSLEARLLHSLAVRIRTNARAAGHSQSAEALRLAADQFDKFAQDDNGAMDNAMSMPPPDTQPLASAK